MLLTIIFLISSNTKRTFNIYFKIYDAEENCVYSDVTAHELDSNEYDEFFVSFKLRDDEGNKNFDLGFYRAEISDGIRGESVTVFAITDSRELLIMNIADEVEIQNPQLSREDSIRFANKLYEQRKKLEEASFGKTELRIASNEGTLRHERRIAGRLALMPKDELKRIIEENVQ